VPRHDETQRKTNRLLNHHVTARHEAVSKRLEFLTITSLRGTKQSLTTKEI
jgi:hypothetical protein